MKIDETKINRVEVITLGKERHFVKYNCKVQLSVQDKERTLKIFVE